jgi:hypothetical protein
MERNDHSPFWNQDAIMSAGLAFAGMAVLQSKLVPAVSGLNSPMVRVLLNWKIVEWWPVLLIVSGLIVWVRDVRQNRSRRSARNEVKTGGAK